MNTPSLSIRLDASIEYFKKKYALALISEKKPEYNAFNRFVQEIVHDFRTSVYHLTVSHRDSKLFPVYRKVFLKSLKDVPELVILCLQLEELVAIKNKNIK